MDNNERVAADVLVAVGGKENITFVTHCMTRLRFNLKDHSIPDLEKIKNIKGVLGVLESGGQLQIVIGQNVAKVYASLCMQAGIKTEDTVQENLDTPREKLTAKKVGSNILNYLSGSLVPLIPILIAAAMFKTVLAVIGPDMLKLVSEKSDLYVLLNFVYNAGFYFLPIYVGYTAAQKIGVTPVLGMFMGGILIEPDFVALAAAHKAFTVYGIPTSVNDYSQSVLPILLSVWVMSYIEKFIKKHMPDSLTTIFTPFLTMFIMVPISLCLLAPAGAFLGKYIGEGLIIFGNHGGFIAVAVIAALWEFLVMSGMHLVLIVTAITIITSAGSESLILPAANCATWAALGMALGAFLRLRNKEEKTLSLGYFISGLVGGVTEPTLYGIGFKYKKPFLGMIIGAAAGGLYAGLTHVGVYVMGATNFLSILNFVAGGTSNIINGIISCMIAMIASAIAVYLIGFKSNDLTIENDKAA